MLQSLIVVDGFYIQGACKHRDDVICIVWNVDQLIQVRRTRSLSCLPQTVLKLLERRFHRNCAMVDLITQYEVDLGLSN